MYQSIIKFGNETSLLCFFRQWKTKSHDSILHGHSLSFKFILECNILNKNRMIVDSMDVNLFRKTLDDRFNNKIIVAIDDPSIGEICELFEIGVAHVSIEDKVSIEVFAQIAFDLCEEWLYNDGHTQRVSLKSCEVTDNGLNSCVYISDNRNKFSITKKKEDLSASNFNIILT